MEVLGFRGLRVEGFTLRVRGSRFQGVGHIGLRF